MIINVSCNQNTVLFFFSILFSCLCLCVDICVDIFLYVRSWILRVVLRSSRYELTIFHTPPDPIQDLVVDYIAGQGQGRERLIKQSNSWRICEPHLLYPLHNYNWMLLMLPFLLLIFFCYSPYMLISVPLVARN